MSPLKNTSIDKVKHRSVVNQSEHKQKNLRHDGSFVDLAMQQSPKHNINPRLANLSSMNFSTAAKGGNISQMQKGTSFKNQQSSQYSGLILP